MEASQDTSGNYLGLQIRQIRQGELHVCGVQQVARSRSAVGTIREAAVLPVEQVHILHRLVNHVVVFRLQFGSAVGEQQADEGVKKLQVALGRLQREGINARAILADTIDPTAIQLDDTLIAATDIEDVTEAAVFLFEGNELVPMDRFDSRDHDAGSEHKKPSSFSARSVRNRGVNQE